MIYDLEKDKLMWREVMADLKTNYGNWAAPETMTYFGTSIHLYARYLRGELLVTSEQDSDSRHPVWEGKRCYSLRELNDGEVKTVSGFGEYESLDEAKDAMKYHIAAFG